MATVHLGRLLGPVGFSRTVAIKRLHAQFASDPEFVSMFLDEARLAARIRHPNVVPTLDVVATGGELFLVMDYVPGESVARLSRVIREQQQTIPQRVISAIMAGVLHGLHAAHEAKDERGDPLGIVHRDMSPQNVLVGTDGVARVLDFGVAKAAGRMQTTREGQIKGKLSYMPPEQLRGAAVSRQTDIYAAGVMLWELVTGQRLFSGDNEGAIVAKILEGRVELPSKVMTRGMSKTLTLSDNQMRSLEALDSTIMKALAMNAEERFATAREMALEIERKCAPATGSEVADWVEHVAKDVLNSRAAMVAEIESSASMSLHEGQGHVQSVLAAKATLQPSQFAAALSGASGSGRPSAGVQAAPSSATRLDRPPSVNLAQQTIAMHGGPPVSRPSHPAPVDGPPVTQPSSISVATGTHGRRDAEAGGRRTLIAAVVGVLLGASVLASALVYRYTQRGSATADHPTSDPSGNVSSQPTAPPITPTTPPATSAVAADADAGATDPASGSAPAAPGAVVVGATTAPTATPTPTTKPTGGRGTPPKPKPAPTPTEQKQPEPKPAPVDCSTPFWYDGAGVKHYKPECLQR